MFAQARGVQSGWSKWDFPWGYPNSWMVFVRENPVKMDDDWRYPYFRKPRRSDPDLLQKEWQDNDYFTDVTASFTKLFAAIQSFGLSVFVPGPKTPRQPRPFRRVGGSGEQIRGAEALGTRTREALYPRMKVRNNRAVFIASWDHSWKM